MRFVALAVSGLAVTLTSAGAGQSQPPARRVAQVAWGGKTNGAGHYADVNGIRLHKSFPGAAPLDTIPHVLYCSAMNEVSPSIVTLVADVPDTGIPLIFRILNASRELQARLEGALDEIGLSMGKAGVLKTLAKAGKPVPLSELAECNKCVRSNVTQLVDRLEADGLVRRTDDPDDRRVTLASLTPEGRKAFQKAVRVIELQEEAILRVLNPKEGAALVRLLEELTP